MKATPILTSFAGGELTPFLNGRVDFDKYSIGCRTLENFFIHPHGPAQNRSGFRFVAEAKGNTNNVQLIPFIFSTEQAYIIELGHDGSNGYMRFYMNGGQIVLDWASATELVTNGGFDVDTSSWTALNSASLSSIAGGQSGNCCQCQENGADNPGLSQTITVAEHTQYKLKFYVQAGTEATYWYEIYDESNAATIYTADKAEATASWVQHEKEFYTPMGCISITIKFYVECAAGSGLTCLFDTIELKSLEEPYEITAPYASADIPDVKYCQSADVMYLTHPSYGLRKLSRTGHTSWTLTAPTLTVDTGSTFNAAADDYPSCCVFHENRFCLANTNNDPNTIWLSKAGDFENFVTGATDDDAIIIDLASDQVNAVRDLKSGLSLIALTTGGEWRISAVDEDEPITPTNITAKRETVNGSYNAMAVQVGSSFCFIQYSQLKILELKYDWESGGYIAPDLIILSEHLAREGSGITKIAYQKEPYSILWAITTDGDLFGCTFMRHHDVVSWHKHPIGGDGDVESIACIPGTLRDELWAVIERTINGSTTKYIEYMESAFDDSDTTSAFFLDAGITVTATSDITSIDDPVLWPLAGEECGLIMNGSVQTDVTVGVDGTLTLPRTLKSGQSMQIGKKYTAKLSPMRLEVPMKSGTSQGKEKAYNQVILRLHKTLGAKVGPDENNLDIIPFRTPDMAMDSPPSLLTGDTDPIPFPGGYTRDGNFIIVQDQPLPITVIGIMPVVDIREE
jgi:hypothetical protein